MNVVIEHHEDLLSSFKGTIIDIETIGDFCNFYDSRRYKDLIQAIFGYVNERHLHIYCAKGEEGIKELKEKTKKIIDTLERPFYAFNCHFEMGVLYHQLGKAFYFAGELQHERESKRQVVRALSINNYDDPFNDNGLLCSQAWQKGEFAKAIAHNRACLLKERDILLGRGARKPDKLIFVKGSEV